MSDESGEIGEGEIENVELPPGALITQSKTYKIVQRLGEGGFGKVYKVFDPIMNRYAALKMIKMNVPEDERRRFRQEARLCGTFMHPNLIRTIEVGTTQEHGLFWFAMEYLDGSDLMGYLDRREPLAFEQIREIFRQTLDALTHVHARNFVHCDIKPANIFVATDLYDRNLRLVKLIDFGVAKDLADPNPTPSKRIMGDPFYMPPEQTYANPQLDARADLYALGMTFYEVITGGRHPFEDLFQGTRARPCSPSASGSRRRRAPTCRSAWARSMPATSMRSSPRPARRIRTSASRAPRS
ncbi:MAG: serine/threonine protein kinase [Deltaproteobacteria bacterium]|nr:serine/threonine protein kinase [Deltaproteobacteria bacterium]